MKALATSACLVVALGAAEVRADTAWSVGFKGGVSIATAGGSDAGDAGSRTAFVGGGFAQADLSKSVGIRFEGLYFMKGATGTDIDFDGGVDLDYIEFPVLLVGQVPVSPAVTLNAFAGPSFSINVNSTAEIEIGGLEFSTGIDEAISDLDLGLTLGVGASFVEGSVRILLDARYDLGLVSVDDGLDPAEELDLKNEAWAIMAGIGFPIGAE